MAVKLTIIGLGQMGGSIGLALAPHAEKIQRIGHDREPETARAAQKAGAVGAVNFNLPASVEGADLVALAIPLNGVRDTLNFIREDLKEGAVILDFSPAKRQGENWARESLPAGRYYVGLVPAINPAYFLETGGGLDAAHADLFAGATVLVCLPPGAPENVARLATDFVKLLDATPILSDAQEADGLIASMIALPKLLAVSLVDLTMEKPGWRDAQNMAHRSYAMPVASAFDRDDADGLRDAALANRDNILRALDAYIESLRELRENIQSENREALGQTMRAAQARAYTWLAERHLEKYRPVNREEEKSAFPSPSLGARIRQMLLGKREPRPPK